MREGGSEGGREGKRERGREGETEETKEAGGGRPRYRGAGGADPRSTAYRSPCTRACILMHLDGEDNRVRVVGLGHACTLSTAHRAGQTRAAHYDESATEKRISARYRGALHAAEEQCTSLRRRQEPRFQDPCRVRRAPRLSQYHTCGLPLTRTQDSQHSACVCE
eukprot:3541031-Rhodomonas_salina.1